MFCGSTVISEQFVDSSSQLTALASFPYPKTELFVYGIWKQVSTIEKTGFVCNNHVHGCGTFCEFEISHWLRLRANVLTRLPISASEKY